MRQTAFNTALTLRGYRPYGLLGTFCYGKPFADAKAYPFLPSEELQNVVNAYRYVIIGSLVPPSWQLGTKRKEQNKHGTEVKDITVYKGIVRGRVIELEGEVVLPEGAEVEVVVKEPRGEEATSSVYPKGSPQAILAAWDIPPRCAPEDVDALLQAIEKGKRPLRFDGVFDQREGTK